MDLLIHTCCAPCLSGSRIPFEEEGLDLTAYWFDPNIQPFSEHQKRLHTLERYLFLQPMEYRVEKGYQQNRYLFDQIENLRDNDIIPNKELMNQDERRTRCRYCYDKRAFRTARYAKENGFERITTTLLLSKYQNHEDIRSSFKEASETLGLEFLYKDLRKNWKDSLEASGKYELYRQRYCGCVFSEHERYGSK